MIKKFKHTHIVDGSFARSGEYRYTVGDLNELEAKDLACDLMDCIQKMQNQIDEIRQIPGDHGFCVG